MKKINQRIIAIVGPTATGKTKKALSIAKELLIRKEFSGVDIISVDSRQVYKGLGVLTGADVPEGFVLRHANDGTLRQAQGDRDQGDRDQGDRDQGDNGVMLSLSKHRHNQFDRCYFVNNDDTIRTFGISIIKPSEEWSVAHFRQMAREIIKNSWQQDRLVILVGGTGLYHKHLFSNDTKLGVPPNQEIRQKAETMALAGLQNWLKKVDAQRFLKMNQSDRANKRRLIRAIEVVMLSLACPAKRGSKHENNVDTLRQAQGDILRLAQHDSVVTLSLSKGRQAKDDIDWTKVRVEKMFLTAPLAELKQRIHQRVTERFCGGAVEEVKQLLKLSLPSSAPVLSTLGVPEIAKCLSNELSAQETIDLWALHEFQYAKRQLTWWKKQSALFN